jgi:hypothetical protein
VKKILTRANVMAKFNALICFILVLSLLTMKVVLIKIFSQTHAFSCSLRCGVAKVGIMSA